MTEPALEPRGHSNSLLRDAQCKDCRREFERGDRTLDEIGFSYNEAWAVGQVDRGGSRSDRCKNHREKHRQNIQGMAVAYIDLETVGEVLDRDNPTGPLGGLGPLPDPHIPSPVSQDLDVFGFGMDQTHVKKMLGYLQNPATRVLIVKAGTGTGKSTYMPYRFLDPPEGSFSLAELGPIVVTEPRVQATVGVANFVGEKLAMGCFIENCDRHGRLTGDDRPDCDEDCTITPCSEHSGPGFPVGHQVSGDRYHDDACQLVYVTDGTMINWLREGRLNRIGTVVVDEAHERSTNIDFIMGYLKRELPRYPHLRVIVTSATFNAEFYRDFFGPEQTKVVDVKAKKTIGYGFPLFPNLDVMDSSPDDAKIWATREEELPLATAVDPEAFIAEHWKTEVAKPLKADEVLDPDDVGFAENLHDTTRALIPLRYQPDRAMSPKQWKRRMPETLARFVVDLTRGLDEADIFGDVLAFLATGQTIEDACTIIRAGVGDSADVFALLSSLDADEKRRALAARRKGHKRKIVVSSNLAETSLTVEGVRFVVDSGLICQSEWDPTSAQGRLPTVPHSQSGIKQRWGRVGRKAPGWVFPLYTKSDFISLKEDTPPGSTRSNLESLVMTAKLGGIDDVKNFDWPAKHKPTSPEAQLDEAGVKAQGVFLKELERASIALSEGGAVDDEGHPTAFGKELARFQGLGSTSSAMAIMYADRLGCVPEVATILALLDGKWLTGNKGLLQDHLDWPNEWRFEAAQRHRALASGCEDDAELVLQIMAIWERAHPDRAPWDPSHLREGWARKHWIGNDVLLAAATTRHELLSSLSPAMKEEVKRFIEPALLRRARGAISRALSGVAYHRLSNGLYQSDLTIEDSDTAIGRIADFSARRSPPDRIVPLLRNPDYDSDDDQYALANVVLFEPWATEGLDDGEAGAVFGVRDAMRLLQLSATHAQADTAKDTLSTVIRAWPPGLRTQLTFSGSGTATEVRTVRSVLEPAEMPAESPSDDSTIEDDSHDQSTSDDDGDETDAAPESDTDWPSANPKAGDPEEDERAALVETEQIEAEHLGCGVCDQCLIGNESECLDTTDTPLTPDAVDALAAWRTRATLDIDATQPQIRVVDGSAADDR